MKRHIFCILFLFLAAPATVAQVPGMFQPLLVASSTPIGTPVSLGSGQASSTTSITMTTGAAIPAGSLSFVCINLNKATTISVSAVSDGTNSYSLARTSTYSITAGSVVEIWIKENATAVGSGATITATASSTVSTNASFIAAGYATGLLTSASLDKVNSADYVPGTAYASGSTGTLSQANELSIGCASGYTSAAAATVTESSGYTQVVERQQGSGAQGFIHIGAKILAATTAQNYSPSLSTSAYGSSLIATFKGN